MCLIIFAPNIRRATIRKTVLQRGFHKNDDGAGIAFIDNGEVKVSKAVYHTFDDFYKAYQQVRSKITKGPLLIHFRWGTCGPKNYINTQPIVIYRNRLVMAHNGVFPALSFINSEISDSVVLAKNIKEGGWNYPLSQQNKAFLEALCGQRSKLVFLASNGKHTIINEKLGAWRAGAWYSDAAKVLTKPKEIASTYDGYGPSYAGSSFNKNRPSFGGYEEMFGLDSERDPRLIDLDFRPPEYVPPHARQLVCRKSTNIIQTTIKGKDSVPSSTRENFSVWDDRIREINAIWDKKTSQDQIKILPPDATSARNSSKEIIVPRDPDVVMHQDFEEKHLLNGRSSLG